MGDKRNAYMFLVGKSEGKRPLGKHGLRLEENIGPQRNIIAEN
jgi:hypothetical protein